MVSSGHRLVRRAPSGALAGRLPRVYGGSRRRRAPTAGRGRSERRLCEWRYRSAALRRPARRRPAPARSADRVWLFCMPSDLPGSTSSSSTSTSASPTSGGRQPTSRIGTSTSSPRSQAAYGKGYCDALTEDAPGSLCEDWVPDTRAPPAGASSQSCLTPSFRTVTKLAAWRGSHPCGSSSRSRSRPCWPSSCCTSRSLGAHRPCSRAS